MQGYNTQTGKQCQSTSSSDLVKPATDSTCSRRVVVKFNFNSAPSTLHWTKVNITLCLCFEAMPASDVFNLYTKTEHFWQSCAVCRPDSGRCNLIFKCKLALMHVLVGYWKLDFKSLPTAGQLEHCCNLLLGGSQQLQLHSGCSSTQVEVGENPIQHCGEVQDSSNLRHKTIRTPVFLMHVSTVSRLLQLQQTYKISKTIIRQPMSQKRQISKLTTRKTYLSSSVQSNHI